MPGMSIVSGAAGTTLKAQDQREAEIEARAGLPARANLCSRQARRLLRWTQRLAAMSPRGQAALAAKASALLALQETETAGRWVGGGSHHRGQPRRDAVRIATVLAGEGDSDAELLTLGRAWTQSCTVYLDPDQAFGAACNRMQDPPVPEELFFRSGDQGLRVKVEG